MVGCEEQMLLLHRVSFYAADALSLVYFMETFKLDLVQHPGKPIAALGLRGFYSQPIQGSNCKEFNRGFIFFFWSFHRHSALGSWLSADWKFYFALERSVPGKSQDGRIDGMKTSAAAGRERVRERGCASGAAGRRAAGQSVRRHRHPRRQETVNTLPWARGFFFLYLEHPTTSRGCLRRGEIWDLTFCILPLESYTRVL